MQLHQTKRSAATVVIPNWNGRDLLEKFLPSVAEALAGNEDNEIIVVDNASTDGSSEYVRKFFPQARVLAQTRNLGFGGGSNAGFRAARNPIVILLNNDMRVEADFLAPLLEPFSDPLVFSVSCQIFFSGPRPETRRNGSKRSVVGRRPHSRQPSRGRRGHVFRFPAPIPAAVRALSTATSFSS